MATFTLSVVAPDRAVVETEATSVIAPGADGYFGVMASHVPIVSVLRAGLLEYQDANLQRNFVAIGGGFAEFSGNKMTILADSADLAEEVDVARETAALERARKALRGEDSTMTAEQATAELDRAMNRLKAAKAKN
ncbi:MAG: ATP synthase F1 subunit epsilon [Fimbriimonadaceae bacterium]|nr:ATP synthase F1 subunit epsilon [Fimbriimonadaceae bacterium]